MVKELFKTCHQSINGAIWGRTWPSSSNCAFLIALLLNNIVEVAIENVVDRLLGQQVFLLVSLEERRKSGGVIKLWHFVIKNIVNILKRFLANSFVQFRRRWFLDDRRIDWFNDLRRNLDGNDGLLRRTLSLLGLIQNMMIEMWMILNLGFNFELAVVKSGFDGLLRRLLIVLDLRRLVFAWLEKLFIRQIWRLVSSQVKTPPLFSILVLTSSFGFAFPGLTTLFASVFQMLVSIHWLLVFSLPHSSPLMTTVIPVSLTWAALPRPVSVLCSRSSPAMLKMTASFEILWWWRRSWAVPKIVKEIWLSILEDMPARLMRMSWLFVMDDVLRIALHQSLRDLLAFWIVDALILAHRAPFVVMDLLVVVWIALGPMLADRMSKIPLWHLVGWWSKHRIVASDLLGLHLAADRSVVPEDVVAPHSLVLSPQLFISFHYRV